MSNVVFQYIPPEYESQVRKASDTILKRIPKSLQGSDNLLLSISLRRGKDLLDQDELAEDYVKRYYAVKLDFILKTKMGSTRTRASIYLDNSKRTYAYYTPKGSCEFDLFCNKKSECAELCNKLEDFIDKYNKRYRKD